MDAFCSFGSNSSVALSLTNASRTLISRYWTRFDRNCSDSGLFRRNAFDLYLRNAMFRIDPRPRAMLLLILFGRLLWTMRPISALFRLKPHSQTSRLNGESLPLQLRPTQRPSLVQILSIRPPRSRVVSSFAMINVFITHAFPLLESSPRNKLGRTAGFLFCFARSLVHERLPAQTFLPPTCCLVRYGSFHTDLAMLIATN